MWPGNSLGREPRGGAPITTNGERRECKARGPNALRATELSALTFAVRLIGHAPMNVPT